MQTKMKAELRKDQILDCSKKIFSAQGYYETHVEEIIKEAKVGKGTFYRYFKNKEDLFISLLIKYLYEWEKIASVELSQININNIYDMFKRLIKQSIQFFYDNEDLCNIYLRVGPGLNKIFEPYLVRFEEQMLGYIKDYINEGVKLGFFKPDLNIELAANIVGGAYLRVDYYYFVIKKHRGDASFDIDKLTDEFYEIILHGFMI